MARGSNRWGRGRDEGRARRRDARPHGRATYPPKQAATADGPVALSVRDSCARGPGRHPPDPGRRGRGDRRACRLRPSEVARAIIGAVPVRASEIRAGASAFAGNPRAARNAHGHPDPRVAEGRRAHAPPIGSRKREPRHHAPARSSARPPRERDRAGPCRADQRVRVEHPRDRARGTVGREPAEAHVRWRSARSFLLLADEPTRGVDVATKGDATGSSSNSRRAAWAILLISNEIEEILGLAHRVLVMRGGRIVAELSGDEITEEAILAASFGRALAAAG